MSLEQALKVPEGGSPPSERRKLRVCMLAYAFYESDTRILQYATALAQRGDEVDVISLRKDTSTPKCEVLQGVTVHRIQVRTVDERGLLSYVNRISRFSFRSMLFLYRQQRVREYDLIHVHNAPDFLVFSALWSKWKKRPIILDIHDLLPEFFASKFKVSHNSILFRTVRIMEKRSAAFASYVIIANDLWRDRLIARSCKSSKCGVIRNRPDLSVFKRLCKEEACEPQKFLLTYPGSLNWHQGVDIAIRAFASVAYQLPHAEFHIYGEGAAKASLLDLTAELGMTAHIFFHGYLPSPEIAEIMARTNLAIEPKRANSPFGNEALSTKILEFMALGVPVIACKTKIHALYYDESIIQYYENDDPELLAKQILRLEADPELRRCLVEHALEYVRHNSWDARKVEYTDLVDRLAS